MTWSSRLLRVDLSSNDWKIEKIPMDILENYVGGRGLGVKLYYNLVKDATIDPLSEENPLVITTGPVSGLGPMSSRHEVVSKSPLTGTIFDSNSGGSFSKEMRFAGYDAIVIEGSSERPVYLKIEDDYVEILSAENLWGKNVSYVYDKLKSMGSVGCIGRAGEKKILIANIMFDCHHAAGRGGLGAIMGSKNLKAIVIKGSKKPEIKNPEEYREAIKEIDRLLRASTPLQRGLKVFGTPILIDIVNYLHSLPVANFRKKHADELGDISAESVLKRIEKSSACFGCPIMCKKYDSHGRKMPEYETLWAFGPNCENYEFESIIKASNLCDDYGMDTISAGATIAAKKEIEGNCNIEEELRKMAEGESILSYGSKRYAESRGRAEASMSIKRLELPGYHPSSLYGQALSYATSNRGGCHLRAYLVAPEIIGKPKLMRPTNPAEKAGLVVILQNLSAAVSSLVICIFATFAVSEVEFAKLLSGVTGKKYDAEDFLRVGERIYNLERKFNVEAGIIEDVLPDRVFEVGPLTKEIFNEMLQEYYEIRGWKNGVPSEEKLRSLGII